MCSEARLAQLKYPGKVGTASAVYKKKKKNVKVKSANEPSGPSGRRLTPVSVA